MNRSFVNITFILLLLMYSSGFAQSWSSPLKVFGFFQNSFMHSSHLGGIQDQNTFNTQQLNLFFQKDLAKNWTSFVNFEFLNNFSLSKQWGTMNLEEAWIKYYAGPQFTLKLGLQIPIFNNLNEIKNKTPLLPYIVRPLVYESSFGEFLSLEQMTPERTFVQANGFIPLIKSKFDYAFYLGNSPNINNDPRRGQTGVDTTNTFLLGTRLGYRIHDLKLGFSATYDKTSAFKYAESILNLPNGFLEEIQRLRIGSDLSFDYRNFRWESEFISVKYDDNVDKIKMDKWFYYFTLGYFMDEEVFIYYSYWYTKEYYNYINPYSSSLSVLNGSIQVKVPTIGLSYHMTERITFKGQFAQAHILDSEEFSIIEESHRENIFSLAVSVFF